MRAWLIVTAVSISVGAFIGCNGAAPPLTGTTDDLTAAVQTKAESVARQVGGTGGYGGTLMTGYFDHAPMHMGFVDNSSLADSGGRMTVRFMNDTDFDCTFHVNYFADYMGLDEMTDAVDVPAGGQIDYQMPCAEIVGLGNLDTPGATGCVLSDGATVPNTMAVPEFLGLDYACGGMPAFHLTPDVDDLDSDGDTEELVLVSDALEAHMAFGGPMGHSHRDGGMMGGQGHFNPSGPSADLPDEATNGESIFLTGATLDGRRIEFDGGPFWLTAHGGGCAACHGTDGSGGLWVMMTDETAPDIRYATLTGQHDDGDHEDHPPYTDESLAKAIRLGIDPAGEPLSTAMPRWNLSDEDLADLIAYLKTLDESSAEN